MQLAQPIVVVTKPPPVCSKMPSERFERTCTPSGFSMSDHEDMSDCDLPSDVAFQLVQHTETRVNEVLAQSRFILTHCTLYDMPQFEREEIELGELLGHGGFSNVFAIDSFHGENELISGKNQGKQYVMKCLNSKLISKPKKLQSGAKDLVIEAHFLASLKHEHILELRGWCAAGVSGFIETCRADGFFLILDRLPEILSKRINSWRERSTDCRDSSLASQAMVRKQLFAERVQCALDIAEALEYLHQRCIIYRDLKPGNVGFDAAGTLKLFDFGLAVELPKDCHRDSLFNLHGKTGTSRYMSVEVLLNKPYNVKTDVFSFSILLWEMMSLSKPYDGLQGEKVQESVIQGERPTIPRSWPNNLRRIVRRGWAESISSRPHINEVKDVLTKLRESTEKLLN